MTAPSFPITINRDREGMLGLPRVMRRGGPHMNCNHCGAALPVGAERCEYCGAATPYAAKNLEDI